MPLKSKDKVLRIEKDIRALLEQNKSSKEIMDILKIPERTFRRYSSRIYQQDQKIWLSITKHQLSTQLIKLKDSLEETYNIAKDMALDPKYEDRIGALNCMNDSRLSIVQLLRDVDMIGKLEPSQQKKDSHQYEEQYEWRENGEKVLEDAG